MTHGASRAWGAATVAAVVVGTAGAFATLPTPDVTWLLHVAGVVLDGGRLGVDVVENSPPTILWLMVPAVALARKAGWDSWGVWIGVVSVIQIASLLVSRQLLRKIPSLRAATPYLTLVVAVGLFLLPRQQFGQREHVTVALALPWLLATAAMVEGVTLHRRGAWAVAITAGIGLAIKPHFALVWFAVVAILMPGRRDMRALVNVEVATPALAAVSLVLAALMIHPGWLVYARDYWPLYGHFLRANPLWVGLVGEGVEWAWLGLLALIAFAPALGPLPRALVVLASAMVAFHLAAALQMKGWDYQFIPAGVLGLLVASAAGAAAGWSRARLVQRAYRIAVPLGVGAVATLGFWRAGTLLLVPDAKWGDVEVDLSLRPLLVEIERTGDRERLLVLSTNIGSGWPLAHVARAGWTMRHPSLWVLGVAHARELRTPGLVPTRDTADWSREERRMVDEMRVDIASRPPTMVILPEPAPTAPTWAQSQRIDYRPYLHAAAGPRLAACLKSPPKVTGAYLVWIC